MNTKIIDVSHRTRRYQQDIKGLDELSSNDGEKEEIQIPVNITLEAAIAFYEQYAVDKYEMLYKRTANWLKMLFQSNAIKQSLTGGNDAVKSFIQQRTLLREERERKEALGEGDDIG